MTYGEGHSKLRRDAADQRQARLEADFWARQSAVAGMDAMQPSTTRRFLNTAYTEDPDLINLKQLFEEVERSLRAGGLFAIQDYVGERLLSAEEEAARTHPAVIPCSACAVFRRRGIVWLTASLGRPELSRRLGTGLASRV
jgi:hypothetical protein